MCTNNIKDGLSDYIYGISNGDNERFHRGAEKIRMGIAIQGELMQILIDAGYSDY